MVNPPETGYLENLYQELSLALGDAIWAFARLEWLTYEYLGALTADRLDELVPGVPFRSRIQMLRQLVKRRASAESTQVLVLDLLKQAEKLSDKRNTIVHNPWAIWIDFDAREFMTEIQRYSNQGKKLDLGEIRDFTKRTTELEVQLREALDALSAQQ